MTTQNYAERFAAAVVQEVWNEMGRQRITSLRELARRAEMTHTSVNVRMNTDGRTGKAVQISVRDLAAFGVALQVEPSEFLRRAREVVGQPPAVEDRYAVQLEAAREEDKP